MAQQTLNDGSTFLVQRTKINDNFTELYGALPSWIKQSADYTLTSVNTEQKAFNESANGALTLTTGTYFYDLLLHIDTMNATSGNCAVDVLGAGTAVVDKWLQAGYGIDNNNAVNNAFSLTGSAWNSQQSPNSVVTAAVGTAMFVHVGGTFRCTTGGTIIPSITLVTANAAVVKTGSYFMCTRIGGTGATQGAWS